MLVGYMRVSSDGDRQTTTLQRDALLAAGVDDRHLYEDKASGARADRPGLERALAFARSGDCLIVWKLDRLGRSLPHWSDADRIVLSLGNRVILKFRDYHPAGSPFGFIYEAGSVRHASLDEMLRSREASELERLVSMMPWERRVTVGCGGRVRLRPDRWSARMASAHLGSSAGRARARRSACPVHGKSMVIE